MTFPRREGDPGPVETLLGLGFEPAGPVPDHIEDTVLPCGEHKLVADRRAMSTRVSIAAIHVSRHLLEDATGHAFEEMDRLISVLNRFDPVSAVGVLNAEGRLSGPPPELVGLLERSAAVRQASGGAFDITVQPLVDLLHASGSIGRGGPIDQGAWREALERVGADDVRITLDGIAKGFIVDAMGAVLEAYGIDRFLVDAGGDIRASGTREDSMPWQVAIRDPRHGGILRDTLGVAGGAVATSGGYEARFDPEGSWHHIVSARTGCSPDQVLSVTVAGPTVFASDALATAALLMAPAEGVRFIDARSAGWIQLTVASQEEGER